VGIGGIRPGRMGANGGGGASETEALGVGDGEEKSFFF
jgi:hypothetical protein